MYTFKAIRFLAAAALAVGLNGITMAHPVDLNTATLAMGVTSFAGRSASFAAAAAGVHELDALSMTNRHHVYDQRHSAAIGDLVRTGLTNFWPPKPPCGGQICAPVPEPSVFLLMLAGMGLFGFVAYRRQCRGIAGGSTLSGA